MDDGSDGPASPVVNGATSPRENGLDKTTSMPTSMTGGNAVQTKKDVPPHSPRSGTSSNASTPSAKKMDEREKTTTPISKPLTPTSASAVVIGAGLKSSGTAAKQLLQAPPIPGVPAVAYPSHYPPPGLPPHHLAPTGQHPHIDVMAYNGYAAPRSTLQQLYDPHAAMRVPIGSAGIAGGKPWVVVLLLL